MITGHEYQKDLRNPDQRSECRMSTPNPRWPGTQAHQTDPAAEEPAGVATTGKPVTLLRVASTPRRRDTDGQWTDGNTTFLDAEAWGAPAENAADSLRKGDRVVITGRLRTDVYTPAEGPNAGTEQRRLRVVIDELAVSLRHTTVRPARTNRTSGSSGTTGAGDAGGPTAGEETPAF
jgi:single-strand DNA-binding protein